MNILSQVVPGLRDTRTPFSVGLLWSGTLWLIFFLIPKQDWRSSQIKPVVEPLQDLPDQILLVFGLFLVYLLGILLEMLSRIFWGLCTLAFVLFVAGVILLTFRSTRAAVSLSLLLLFAFVSYVALAASRLRRKLQDEPYLKVLEDTTFQVLESLGARIATFFRQVREIAEPDYGSFQELLKTDLELAFGENPDILNNALEAMTPATLSKATEATRVSNHDLYAFASEAEKPKIVRASDASLLNFYIRRDERIAQLAREAMAQKLREESTARVEFAIAVFNLAAQRDRLRARMEQAEVALRVNYKDLYNEIDRIRSEGEFRKGVSWPLAAFSISAVLTIYDFLGFRVTSNGVVLLVFAACAAGVMIYAAGTGRTRRANQLLYACLLQNLVGVTREKLYGDELFIPLERPRIERTPEIRRRVKEILRQATLHGLDRVASRIRPNSPQGASGASPDPKDSDLLAQITSRDESKVTRNHM
ncbi:hypothetical protein [Micromonospora coxensis]|uniref:Uncharacterized protein n=1 Tax=Micromonospora coxensis TaxID=356852 RepID=A0A1C5HS36_9ACTN|nr:hypothetical protein [Micromonospora coxensis]SCG48727.1 hypothetical protein GA0070614_1691 [Micromonospora coxensis]